MGLGRKRWIPEGNDRKKGIGNVGQTLVDPTLAGKTRTRRGWCTRICVVELAVFYAGLDICVCGFDEFADGFVVCGRFQSQLDVAHSLALALQ